MKSKKFIELEKAFHQCVDELGEQILAFPWQDKEAYTLWVAQTYYLVRHTTRLICLAAGKCGIEDEEYHQKQVWHLKEERGHEKLALNDLKALGAKIEDQPELVQTKAIYQSQYYFVDRHGPYSQLGYSMLLEGLAAAKGGPITKIIEANYGKKAGMFLKVHAEEDEGHVAAGLEFLQKLDDSTLDAIRQNLDYGRNLYSAMLTSIAQVAKEGKKSITHAA